jgi:SAM-dependent methyltransferase
VTELPGHTLTDQQLQMICCRYQTASRFVKGRDVLEVGCGPGLGLGFLLRQGARSVVGGDINEKSLQIAREHYGQRVECVSLDAHCLPFEDGAFDVVLLFEAIFYFRKPDVCLSEIRRVLRSGGILVLCLPNKELPGFIPSPFSFQYYSASQLYELLEQRFCDVKVFGVFPLEVGTINDQLRLARLCLAKPLNYVPGGRWLKECVRRRMLGKNVALDNEIPYERASEVEMELLSPGSPDLRHQILYATCHVS